MRQPLSLFETLFKPVVDFFYDLRYKNVRFRQQRNILTMVGDTPMPYQIMKVGDEFYLENISLDKIERQLSKINDYLGKNFVALEDGELIRVIRVK